MTILTVGHSTPVSIDTVSLITLSSSNNNVTGSLRLDEAGTLGSDVLNASGGILDVDKTLTLSGALSQYC